MSGKARYILARIAGLFLVLILGAALALQLPKVQERIARSAFEKLSDMLDGTAGVGEITFTPSGELLLRDFLVMDKNPYTEDIYGTGFEPADTILYIKKLNATFPLRSIISKRKLRVKNLYAEGVDLHVVTEPSEEMGTTSNIKRLFGGPPPPEEPKGGPELFTIRKIRVNDVHFRLTSFVTDIPYKGGLNYQNLDVRGKEIRGRNMKMAGGIMTAVCDHVDARDKCGYSVSHVSAQCRVGMGKALIENIHIVDPWSDIHVKSYCKTYRNSYSFKDYINKVRMEAFLLPSRLAMPTLMNLSSGGFKGNTGIYDIEGGHLEGYVSDASADGITFTEITSGVSGTIDADFSGLPDIESLYLESKFSDFSFTVGALSDFLDTWGAGTDFGETVSDEKFLFNGKISGGIKSLHANGTLIAGTDGMLEAEAEIDNLTDKDKAVEITGRLNAKNIDAGSISGAKAIGKVTFGTDFKAALGKDLSFRTDSLRISGIEAFGYNYTKVSASASFSGNSLHTNLISSDPGLKMNLTASADIKPGDGPSEYRIKGRIDKAALRILAPAYKESDTELSFGVFSEISYGNKSIDGNVSLADIKMKSGSATDDIGDLLITAATEGGSNSLELESSFMKVFLKSDGPVQETMKDLTGLTVARELPALFSHAQEPPSSAGYDIRIEFNDSRNVLSHLFPGLYIADRSRMEISVNDSRELTGKLHSARIAYGKNFIKGAELSVDNMDGSLNATLTGEQIQAGNLSVRHPELNICAKNNEIATGFLYEGTAKPENGGKLYVSAVISRDVKNRLTMKARPIDSHIQAGDEIWELGNSEINLTGRNVKVNGFSIINADQRLLIDGGLSPDATDTLSITLDNLKLSSIDNFLKDKAGIQGTADGKAFITSPTKDKLGMLMNIKCDSLSIRGRRAGDFRVSSMWDDENKKFSLFLNNTAEGRTALYGRGVYRPETKELHASLKMDEFSISPAGALTENLLEDINGSVSGEIMLDGHRDNLTIKGKDTRLNNIEFKVGPTEVPYIISGPFSIERNVIWLDGISVTDLRKGTGTLKGSIRHKNLKDIQLDATLNCRDLTIFNSLYKGDATPYGHLSVSGYAKATGPMAALSIEGDLSTSREGDIHIPLAGSISGQKSDLLTFVDEEKDNDPYEQMLKSLEKQRRKSDGSIRAKANINIEQGVEAFVEIDKSAGNVISFRGDGRITADLQPSKGILDLNGNYDIKEGNYHFVLPGIFAKDFEIQDGSSITFGGDLMNSQINISAKHKLKASLSSLIASSSTVANRRPVECGLDISNKLKNPNLKFSINVPDLDPTTKSQVESALNTEDKIQKQFISLLLVGSFVPSETSGVFNSQSVLLSNASEIMSNQLNSILQRLEIPVDFGFDYQGYQEGANIFDVAVSTQLFNNRVVINGSFGNRKYTTTTTPSGQMIGDLDIEVKLDKPGRFRLNLFSHSADDYTNFLDNKQRNGLGLSYQKEFSINRPDAEDVIIKIEDEQRKVVSDTIPSRGK